MHECRRPVLQQACVMRGQLEACCYDTEGALQLQFAAGRSSGGPALECVHAAAVSELSGTP